MARVLCLAEAHGAAKPARSKTARGTRTAKEAPKPQTFTIIERVPVRLSAHTALLAALRKHAMRQPIVDAEHPGDAFAADVVMIDRLSGDAVAAIAGVLLERRAMLLGAAKDVAAADILGRRLDRAFEQEMEWLAIRNLLAAAIPRSAGTRPAKRRRRSARALLIIDV